MIFLIITGMFGGPTIYIVLPIILFFMKKKELYEEMFIGFFLFLILSDSYEIPLLFAKSAKNIYIVALAIFFFFDRTEFYPFNTTYKLFMPFFLISVYCLIYTETLGISVQKTLSYFLLFLIVPNYFTKLYREKGPVILQNIIYFAFTILFVSFAIIFIHRDLVYPIDSRYRGIFGNPNGLGLFCFFTFLFFSILRWMHKELFTSAESIIIYSLVLVSLLLTGSRNSIVGVIIFVLFQKIYKINPFLGFILVIIVGVGAEYIGNHFSDVLSSLGLADYFRAKTLDNGSGRYAAWYFAWTHIQQSFFIGRGFGYDEHFMRSNWDLLSKLGHQGGIHNTFLTFWMDFGLIGLLIFLRSYILAFIQAAKKSFFAYPVFFAVTFAAFFESWLVGSLNPHTILFLLILTLISDDTFYTQTEEIEGMTLAIDTNEHQE
ncbi:MAG: O-antigen ligase family protein [Bacteroidia bacterium]